jgi:hypothetical protein
MFCVRAVLLLSSLVTLAGLLSGCPQPRSEGDTLELQAHGVHVPPLPGALAFTAEQPVLVGSRLCGRLHCTSNCPSAGDAGTVVLFPEVGDCYAASVEGPASLDDAGCLTFEQEGAVAWAQAATGCDLASEDGGWAPTDDRFLFVATTLVGLQARFEHALEAYGAATLISDDPEYVPTAAFPADFLPTGDDPLPLLAGEEVQLRVTLIEASSGQVVGYRPAQVIFEVTETRAAAGGGPAAEVELVPGGFPIVTMAAAGEVEVAMRIDDADGEPVRLVIGLVRGVAATALDTLEVVGFRREPADQGAVLGLRAIVRDGIGHAVFGVPVAWELTEGRFVVEDLTRFGGRRRPPDPDESYVAPAPGEVRADWIYLSDDCLDPNARLGDRAAQVVARFGTLEATLAATWEQVGPEPTGANFEPSTRCEGVPIRPDVVQPDVGEPDPEPDGPPDDTCGCRTVAGRAVDSGPAMAWLGVTMVGAAFWRRRRRR